MKTKRKPYKKQEDRLLRNLSQAERRYQTMLRTRIYKDNILGIYV